MDMLVEQTHHLRPAQRSNDRPLRFTDTRTDEQARGVSLKAVPMSLVLESSSGKSYVASLMDAPGHLNFSDEMCAALRLADGALLVVDAAEGAMVGTERAVRAAAAEGLPLCLLLSKVDRLVTELKLPPADAYHKLRHSIEEVNALIRTYYGEDERFQVRGYEMWGCMMWWGCDWMCGVWGCVGCGDVCCGVLGMGCGVGMSLAGVGLDCSS